LPDLIGETNAKWFFLITGTVGLGTGIGLIIQAIFNSSPTPSFLLAYFVTLTFVYWLYQSQSKAKRKEKDK